MSSFDLARFVNLSKYWCEQRELSLSSKIPDVRAQAQKQMKAVDKEQERMLEQLNKQEDEHYTHTEARQPLRDDRQAPA
jgi:hypothetical protein